MVVRSKLFFVLLMVLILLIPQNDTLFNKIIKPTMNAMKPTAVYCVLNPNRVTNVSCSIKAISRGVTEINAYADLVEPLRNISLRVEAYKLYNGYRPFVATMTEYWCEFMAGRRWSPLSKIAAQHLKNTSNLNATCPIEKTIIVRGFKYVAEYFPLASVVPRGKYKIIVTVNDDTQIEPYIGRITMTADVEENIKRPQ